MSISCLRVMFFLITLYISGYSMSLLKKSNRDGHSFSFINSEENKIKSL